MLLAATLYDVLWGAFVVLFPLALFRFFGFALPNYPEIWHCVVMSVGVYGVGYAAAALDALRHWPVVLVGLLGKVFGPVGFVSAVAAGDLPPRLGLTLLTNDAIWWFLFARNPTKGTGSGRQRKRAPVYVVLGATGGIGSDLCRRLAKCGAKLVVGDR